jgi:hypothetical protein
MIDWNGKKSPENALAYLFGSISGEEKIPVCFSEARF